MIETFRKKYLSAWLVGSVMVFILIGFIFNDSRRNANASSGVATKVLRINGETYTLGEYAKKGEAALQVAYQIGQQDFVTKLTDNSSNPVESFFIHRILLQKKSAEFGIEPSNDAIKAFLRTCPAFQDPSTQQFQAETYTTYIKNHLGPLGMTEANLHEIVADILRLQQLEVLVATGVQANHALVAKGVALEHQWISGISATQDVKAIRAGIQSNDAEIKQYWDTLRDSFKTPLKRKFSYIITSIPERNPEEKDAKAIEAHQVAKKAIDQKMNGFVTELMKQKGSSFEELAKKQNLPIVKSDWIALDAEPTGDLARLTDNQSSVFQALMSMKTSADPASKISDAIPLKNGSGWLIAHLDEEQTPRVETFEEARERAKAQWISEKSLQAITARATTLQKEANAALQAGKSFESFAKEQKLSIKAFSEISSKMPMTEPLPSNLFQLTNLTKPGQLINNPVVTENAITLVWVSKRETPKQKDTQEVATMQENLNQSLQVASLLSWFKQQVKSSQIERLVNLNPS